MLEAITRVAAAPINQTLLHKAERKRFADLERSALSRADDRGALAFAERARYHAALEWGWRLFAVIGWGSVALVVVRMIP